MMKNTEIRSPMSERSDEILQIIRSNATPMALRERLEDYHENDIAAVLPELREAERRKLCRVLDPDALSDVFSYLDDEEAAADLLSELDIKRAVEVVDRMEADDAVPIIRRLNRNKRDVLLDLLDVETRRDIALIASFDDEEIGSKMTTDYIEMPMGCTAHEAMASLSQQAREVDNISTIYVLDTGRTFCGAVPLRDLITADGNTALTELTITSFPYVYAQELVEDCIETLKDYSEDSIPVLDHQNRVLGIVTAQSLMELSDAEMDEDYARLAGLTAQNDLRESVRESVRKRLPWLLILLGLGMVVSSVVGMFEGIVAQLPLIIAFQSLILDMAGNVGTQSLAVTIRVLTDETIPARERLRLVPREMQVALLNGILLGLLAFGIVGCYLMLAKGLAAASAFAMAGCIGLSLMAAMMVSGLFGTIIPMIFKRVGVDPAVASGPLITTINDLVAVVVYYGLAWLFLLQIFHVA
mgnify:CR=1 FL=1